MCTHGNVGEILQGTLLPSVVHKTFPARWVALRVGILRRCPGVDVGTGRTVVTGEMKKAGGAMVSDAALIIDFEAAEISIQALLLTMMPALPMTVTGIYQGGA